MKRDNKQKLWAFLMEIGENRIQGNSHSIQFYWANKLIQMKIKSDCAN